MCFCPSCLVTKIGTKVIPAVSCFLLWSKQMLSVLYDDSSTSWRYGERMTWAHQFIQFGMRVWGILLHHQNMPWCGYKTKKIRRLEESSLNRRWDKKSRHLNPVPWIPLGQMTSICGWLGARNRKPNECQSEYGKIRMSCRFPRNSNQYRRLRRYRDAIFKIQTNSYSNNHIIKPKNKVKSHETFH